MKFTEEKLEKAFTEHWGNSSRNENITIIDCLRNI